MKLSKFSYDLGFNYLSLALLGCSGILINLFIIKAFGASTLGKFNLIYANYIVISQCAVLGIHYSVQRSLSIDKNASLETVRNIVTTALLLTTLISLSVALITYFSANIVIFFYDDLFVFRGIEMLSVAIPLFALNKMLLASFNGKRYMRLFALGQGLRYFLMLLLVAYIAYQQLSSMWLTSIFFFAELILFTILAPIAFFTILSCRFNLCSQWFRYHLKFGTKAFLSGFFLEINSRIDVIILAYFVPSAAVGIYSFAAMIAEGFSMILMVLRNNVNPIIANYLSKPDEKALRAFMLKVRKHTYLGMTTIITLSFVTYFGVIKYLLNVPELNTSWQVLLIISCCCICTAGYLPFSDFLTQANKPFFQSLQNIIVVVSNILLTLLLAPFWGIIGAALATGISSYIISVLLIDWFAKREGINFLHLQSPVLINIKR